MKTYHYDEQTKEYTHSEEAFLDPLESKKEGSPVYLLPANGTFVAPTPQDGYASVWNGKAWDNIEDNRGKKYWLSTDSYGTEARTMTELGAMPNGATFTAPLKSLKEAQEYAVYLLKQARDNAETQPIEVDGNTYDYDDKARERMRIARQALDDGLTDTLQWTLADNTVTTVNLDTFIHINNQAALRSSQLHSAYNERKARILSATDTQTLDAILREEGICL